MQVLGYPTVNFDVAVPDGFVTVILPDCALAGTVRVSLVADTTLNFAGTPWIVTDVVLPRFVPVTVTLAPRRACVGVTFAIVGTRRRQRQEAVLDEQRLPRRAQHLLHPRLRRA
jgi:hypothetical protein